jgi:hypothetical protein
MPTATLRFTLRGHASEVYAVALAPDGNLLASGSRNKKLRLWDPRTGRLVRELTGHAGAVRALAFSPDGTVLACGSHSKRRAVPDEIVLWDPHAGSVRQRLLPGRPVPGEWQLGLVRPLVGRAKGGDAVERPPRRPVTHPPLPRGNLVGGL